VKGSIDYNIETFACMIRATEITKFTKRKMSLLVAKEWTIGWGFWPWNSDLPGVTIREGLGLLGNMVSIPHNGVGGFLCSILHALRPIYESSVIRVSLWGLCLATCACYS
jgi:hypothetical protein